ncbi:alpha/beta fold hydrolase [Gordonia soli]|uniref:Putative lipase n=1 Tax=Gordonia soli NBRC 108243 TaxID=1223545 RepID=M0QFB7_9ACTN|nr:alpha/beta fold hydrolase [Gordonia soli]GAC67295.1 putative lipase [Gordonia soli NBRC 108243]
MHHNVIRADRRPWRHRATLILVAALVAGAGVIGSASPTSAAPGRLGSYGFYQPPQPLPSAKPGTILRRQVHPVTLSVPSQGGPIPAVATRIMYLSNDTHGRPAAVTGTYLRSSLPWNGPGPRPLVSVAPGTQGQGDQCAASKTIGNLPQYRFPLDLWFNYEILTTYTLLARGMNVVMTDYHGLGTPAMHDYVNRLAEGHAVLDSIRAAEQLTGRRAPAVVFGYSQGGGAAASAAELQSTYAPELDLRGTYSGAAPADLREVLRGPVINGIVPGAVGGAGPALLGYALNGIRADYPETRPAIDAALSPYGKQMLAESAQTCIGEAALRFMFRPPNVFTLGGVQPDQIIKRSPALRRAVDLQRIGTLKPSAPVLVAGGTQDDVIPYHQVRRMAGDWCAQGATVTLDTTTWLPPVFPGLAVGHGLEFLPALVSAQSWITDRLAGRPAPNSCRGGLS